MKKVIFILAFMLVNSITFANNSIINKEDIKTAQVKLTDGKKASLLWMSTCTRSVYNRLTGETHTVSGVGFGSTRETAQANCHSQTLKKATELADDLNNQN